MFDVYRYHEISESTRRVLNPITEDRIELLGEICEAGPNTEVLDLACGKGELLCRLASRFGSPGVGVELHPPFVEAAQRRAIELGVDQLVRITQGDAAASGIDGRFAIVSCLGATWIGGGLVGTLGLMGELLEPDGHLLVGEPYWETEPPADYRSEREAVQTFSHLGGTLERFASSGFELVEMVLSSQLEWDRYAASQWKNMRDWLARHPEDPDAQQFRQVLHRDRRAYLECGRRCLGWGIFVLRPNLDGASLG